MVSLNQCFFGGSLIYALIGAVVSLCDNYLFVPPDGVIHSPPHPNQYDNNTNCMWHIKSMESHATIVLSLEELDIEADEPEVCGLEVGSTRPCCKHNWLSMPLSGAGKLKTQQLCGSRPPSKPILVRASEVAVKLHISRVQRGGRGFRLSYRSVRPPDCSSAGMVACGPHPDAGCFNNATQRCDGVPDCISGQDEAECLACQFSCAIGPGCFSHRQRCDGKPDCHDYSDEVDCGYCERGKAVCSAEAHHYYCFRPSTQRCNSRFDCPRGEDEVGCVSWCGKGEIACSSGDGCYSPSQRCDSLSDCLDASDEAACPRELCPRDHRLCRNGHCLPADLWCDGTDDCGDSSDEQPCFRNYTLALSVVGCLFFGLLLTVGVGCAFRLYTSRPSAPHLHFSPHLASRLRMTTSVSLPTLMDDDWFHREPPPAYSEVVGETEVAAPPRRTRRYRPHTRPRPRPVT